jgi:hypothetical protein
MINLKDGTWNILGVFVGAIVVRFGWELGGWIIHKLF